uniref:Baculoviral IAP repeat-containing protein 3-like n=1 Tax=Phallusia mammillata TaxID=59560 RepID=A0A6F9D723_9ASCI|nr:baculoviral IAP repeat-containing protein 3-like [Phallusia mammillata]
MKFENTSSHRMMIVTLAVIFTTNVMTELGFPENNKDWFATKFEILQEIVPDQIRDILKNTSEFETLFNQQLSRPNTQEIMSGFARENLELVCCDGVIQDRPKDPPGQRSVYIPPGDTFMESYRLSTFIRFPEHSPANPRRLASAGFFYTGYKDRVKCFSCGLCVHDWTISDDVRAARWHRDDCPLMKGEDCGNVEIGGGGLARLLQSTDRYQVYSRDLPTHSSTVKSAGNILQPRKTSPGNLRNRGDAVPSVLMTSCNGIASGVFNGLKGFASCLGVEAQMVERGNELIEVQVQNEEDDFEMNSLVAEGGYEFPGIQVQEPETDDESDSLDLT